MAIESEDVGAPSRAERLLYLYLSAEPDIRKLSLGRAARASLRALRHFVRDPHEGASAPTWTVDARVDRKRHRRLRTRGPRADRR